MRKLLLIALLAMPAGPAMPIERYNSTKLQCSEVKAILDRQGAAIFRYPSSRNPSLTLYDRYVRNGSFCDVTQRPERVAIPASDTKSCHVNHCIRADPCDDSSLFCPD